MGVWKLRVTPVGADEKAALWVNCLGVTELIPVMNLLVIHPIIWSYSISQLYFISPFELTIVLSEVVLRIVKIKKL